MSMRSPVVPASRLAATLCANGPPEQTRSLRAWALRQLAAHAGESDRARQMLLSAFCPPLQRVDLANQLAEVERFDETLKEIAGTTDDRRTRADLAFLPLAVRLEVSRTWDAPWFDAAARAKSIEALEQLRTTFGDMLAADGRSYAAVADDCIGELRNLAFGSTVPAGPFQDIDGRPISLGEYRGKVVALVFWSSWCLPCLQAVPDEKAMVSRLASEPFAFIGVNGDATPEAARTAAVSGQIPWRSVFAGPGSEGASLVAHLRVHGWPSVFVLDGEGRIRAKFVASAFRPTYTTDDVERAVRKLLATRSARPASS
jgi:thiol-disulfide isomerase/thioredoxin